MGHGFNFQIGNDAQLTVGERLKTPGVDFGPGLVVVHCSPIPKGSRNQFVVVRRPGHTAWGGVGYKLYYETSYRILRIYRHHCSAKDSLRGRAWASLMAEEVAEEEPGRKWRACVSRLSAKSDELAKNKGKDV